MKNTHACGAAAWLVLVLSLGLQGCASPRQRLLEGVADAMAAQGAAEEEDLQLAREAAPFYLKLSESLLRQTPGHVPLAESVAGGFTQYAYAFVAFEADRIEPSDVRTARRLRERAARLYARAQRHAMATLEQAQPGLRASLDGAQVQRIAPGNVGLAYWAAASWAAGIALSKDRPEAVADLPQAVALARAAYTARPDHAQGALASLMGTLEAARPGGTPAQARAYFDQALQASAGTGGAAVYVAMAESLAQPAGDRAAFEAWLRQAQQAAAGRRDLGNRVMAERADWLLSVVDDLF